MAPTTTTTTHRAGCAASVAPSSLPAHVVGNAFAKQYYSTLQKSSPEIAYRFYLNDSCMARPSGSGDGDCANCVTAVKAIQEKITTTCAGLASVEVLTVDSHHSHAGGVAVLVTGKFTYAGNNTAASPCAFVQSFFLAPQGAKSYYVRSDTLRFVGGGGADTTGTAPGSPSPAMVAEPGKGEEKDVVHGEERCGDSEEGEVEDAAGSSRLGRILGKLRGLLLSPGISVSDEQAEVSPPAVTAKNEQPDAPVKNDEPEENGFLVI